MKPFYEYIDVKWDSYMISLDTGINMSYCRCGNPDGDKIIFIHGVTDGRITWAQVAPKIADFGFDCYIVEYRGNGLTDKPDLSPEGYTAELIADDILNFMDKIGIKTANLVGHSFGSLISQVLAANASERIVSVTLIDSSLDGSNAILNTVRDGDEKDFPGVYLKDEYMPKKFLEDWTYNTNENQDFKDATYAHVAQMPMVAWRNLMEGLTKFDGRKYIKKVKCPTLIMWGTNDDIFPECDQRALKAGLVDNPKARFIEIEGGTHNGFWDSLHLAEKYSKLIIEFINDNK